MRRLRLEALEVKLFNQYLSILAKFFNIDKKAIIYIPVNDCKKIREGILSDPKVIQIIASIFALISKVVVFSYLLR